MIYGDKEAAVYKEGKPYDMLTCCNPTNEDFSFTYKDQENADIPYEIKAGEVREWPRYVVRLYVTRMIDAQLTYEGVKTNNKVKRDDWVDKLLGELPKTGPKKKAKK